ncbi:MAG: ChbG/HpnK family deacetylase [Erysipelotrichales bacterium]|nr:ChbG/HpnK family deacetylase [Erysipelotrichales bacterium]
MRKIIVNADDYGMTKSLNDGIIYAYNNGVLSSTTVMAHLCSIEEIKRLATEAKGIGIGVHLTLTQGIPLTDFSTVREDGTFNRAKIFQDDFNINEVRKEFIAQIEHVKNSGVKLTHLDSHHHVHMRDSIKDLMTELSLKYKLPVRGMSDNVQFDARFYNKTVSLEFFMDIIKNSEGIIEIMTHPSFVDAQLLKATSYNEPRGLELEILTSSEVKAFYKKNNLVKATY